LIIASLVLASCYEFHGDAWQRQTAQAKQAQLWSAITSDTTPAEWPSSLAIAELFIENMNISFDTVADDMPTQFVFHTKRPKLIHSVGPIAQAQWVSNGKHNYTGIFQGGNYGFIRFSLAIKPDPEASVRGFTPGLSIKFLRTGVKSTNFFLMFSLTGQSSFNFFKHDLSNHPPNVDTSRVDLAQRLLFDHFKTASFWNNLMGLAEFAKFNESGGAIAKPNFPYRLVFHPLTKFHTMFPDQNSKPLGQVLSVLPVGPLYEIWAEDHPGADLAPIGTLVLRTSPTSSQFGDSDMFFEHQRMEDDFKYRPEWVGPAAAIQAKQASIPDYTYPDLPWN